MAFEELKQRHSVMWGTGPYENISATLTDIHEHVVERLDPQPGERFLDLACGTGAVAARAARAGARVTGVDLAPDLIETARRDAERDGLEIDYRVGDCENLRELEDGSFDVVASTVGIMFAPDHGASARELSRVTATGGRIGLASWTPEGGIGDMFRTMAPFQPAPPPSSPFEWGREDRVHELLGDAFELTFERHESPFEIPSGEAAWQLFVDSYGPTKTLAASLDDERREELRRAFVDLHERARENGGISYPREYLLVLGRRR